MKATIPDIMAYALAKEVKNGEIFLQGLSSPLPMVAALVAKKFLAPDAVYINVADSVDPEPECVPFSTASWELTKNCVSFVDLIDSFDLAQQGKLGLIFLGGAQIDKYGNTNLSVIGDYYKPKVRLPGGAASSYLCAIAQRTVLWTTNQTKRVFVEKVDFITGQGYLEGYDTRKKLGMPGNGPAKVITNLGVYDFDEESKQMRLHSIHPGVTIEKIKENTGFDLIIPENLKETETPPDEVIEYMNRIDPNNVRAIGVKLP